MAMHFDTVASRSRFDRLLKNHGDRAELRQDGVTRPITVSIQQENSMERLGAASNPLDRIALVSPLDPDTGEVLDPPPSERDVIIVTGPDGGRTLLKIVAPPDSMGADIKTQYWRIKVRA